eukprot:CAMPEP_0170169830 /NCGR_PEP_ID=MMETSP0040_2-20121228/2775_1 /TAXON_ID=641309 /ORGANISM="Lotharella oceanica, Strain CCMP622" /LENGTH=279 /DNA_ID=CAMNT_0010408815 /DNA_START=633 /DNA_END=1472 /DNA_ORIENTATION=-
MYSHNYHIVAQEIVGIIATRGIHVPNGDVNRYQRTDCEEADTDSDVDAEDLMDKEPQAQSEHSSSQAAASVVNEEDLGDGKECSLCRKRSELKIVRCVYCGFSSHLVCLARKFREAQLEKKAKVGLIPEGGECPGCRKWLLWPTVVESYSNQQNDKHLPRRKQRISKRTRSEPLSSSPKVPSSQGDNAVQKNAWIFEHSSDEEQGPPLTQLPPLTQASPSSQVSPRSQHNESLSPSSSPIEVKACRRRIGDGANDKHVPLAERVAKRFAVSLIDDDEVT